MNAALRDLRGISNNFFNSSARFGGMAGRKRSPPANTHEQVGSTDLFIHTRRVLAGPGPQHDRGNHVICPPLSNHGYAVSNKNPNAVRAAEVRKALSFGQNPVRQAAATPGAAK